MQLPGGRLHIILALWVLIITTIVSKSDQTMNYYSSYHESNNLILTDKE